MKKFGIIALFALISVAASAQINVGAGYLQSTATYQAKSGADVNSTKSNGFYVGLGYEIPLMQGLSVTPGIYYSYLYSDDAGSTAIGTVATGSLKTNLKEQYLNIPVTVNFGYNLTRDLRLFAFGGPTASIGLSSVSHYDASVTVIGINISDSGDTDNYSGTSDNPATYGRFDVLLGAGAGADIMGKFRITVGYDWGLLNRNVDSNSTAIRHRNQLKAGIAYLF
ncbi:MAG: PorT family protein [Bacteroidales bacterium]|nr:PorT family protein [Bacteroidales bacterium]